MRRDWGTTTPAVKAPVSSSAEVCCNTTGTICPTKSLGLAPCGVSMLTIKSPPVRPRNVVGAGCILAALGSQGAFSACVVGPSWASSRPWRACVPKMCSQPLRWASFGLQALVALCSQGVFSACVSLCSKGLFPRCVFSLWVGPVLVSYRPWRPCVPKVCSHRVCC